MQDITQTNKCIPLYTFNFIIMFCRGITIWFSVFININRVTSSLSYIHVYVGKMTQYKDVFSKFVSNGNGILVIRFTSLMFLAFM
jgi:hypothetical protein